MKHLDIKGYEGLYKISEDGFVYNIKRNAYLKNCTTGRYLVVLLYKNSKRKMYYVHRLVADAFCVKNNDDDVVNHKDFNKENNHYSNLEWISCKENVNHYRNSIKFKQPIMSDNGKKRVKEFLYKKVKCLQTGTIYKSMGDFAKAKNISLANASIKLNNKYKNDLNAIFL